MWLNTSPCAAGAHSIYDNRDLGTSSGYGGLTLSLICPHFKAWLMVVTAQVLRRPCSLLQAEVYLELTQLELMVNDSCRVPPETHLSRIKVFLLALSSAHGSPCNELCLPTHVLWEIGDLLLALHTTLTRYYCRIKRNYRNMSAPSVLEHHGCDWGCS